MKIKVGDILKEYDIEGEKIELLNYFSLYLKCDESEQRTLPWIAEVLAFKFQDNFEGDSNSSLFVPIMTFKDGAGNIIENPDRKSITSEIIEYWENRINTSKNVLLKARYAGLVWEFKKMVFQEKPAFAIALNYIKALIECARGDYLPYPILNAKYLKRAIILSFKYKQKKLLSAAKRALNDLISRCSDEKAINVWGTPYRILEKYPDVYGQEERLNLIAQLERRFDCLYRGEDNRDPWLLMDIARILAEYYKNGDPDKIFQFFKKVENVFDSISEQLIKSKLAGNYTRLYELYLKYQLKTEAEPLVLKIEEAAKGILSEMACIRQEFEIAPEQINEVIDKILTSNIEESYILFAFWYIPKKESAIKNMKDWAKEGTLFFSVHRMFLAEGGRPEFTVDGIGRDMDKQVVLNISMSMKIETVYLSATIEEGRKRGIFTKENILEYLSKAPAIKSEKLPIITRGIDAYFNDDYLVAIHLLVPQMEAVLRNILEIYQIPTWKPADNGGIFQLRLLDDILRDERVMQLITEDLAYYLRILLTDKKGWNIRNALCHGFAEPSLFNKVTADRIFHALLCLAALKPVEQP